MSELINRIVDIDAIAKQVETTKGLIAEISKSLDDLNKNSLNIIPDIRAAKNADDLSNATKRLNDNIVKGNAEMNVYNEMQKQLETQEKKYVQALATSQTQQSKNQQSLNQLTKANKEQNEQLKQEAILNDKNSGTIEKLTAKNKLLEAEKKKLNLTTKEGTDRLKEINEEQDKNNELLNEASNKSQQQKNNIGNYKSAFGGLIDSFKAGEIGVKGLSTGILQMGKALLANPIILIAAVIIGLVKGIADAFARNEEKTNALRQSFAKLEPIMKIIRTAFDLLASGVVLLVDGLTKGITAITNFFGITSKESIAAAENLAKSEAKLRDETRKSELIKLQYQKTEEKFRQIRDDESKSIKERIEANKKLGETLKAQLNDELKIAKLALKVAEDRLKQDGESTENLDKRAEALTKIADIEERINGQASEQLANENSLRKEAADKAKEAAQKIVDAKRRQVDSELAIMDEGMAKEIAISDENFKRQIEDLKASGDYTKKLGANLEIAHQNEIQKIKENYAKTEEQRQKDEADKQIAEMEKVYANFEKSLQKEITALSDAEKQKELELKKAYARGEISKQEYETKLLKIQNDAAKEANDKTIELLKNELDSAELTADKRAEFSKRLSDLQIANENAAADAAIKANENKLESEKATAEKRKQIATDLVNASFDLFSSIADYQVQQSENRLKEIDDEQSKSDEYFENRQKNLDNAIMSDQARAAAQEKLDAEKAKKDAELEKKKKAERLKQAKWEKAQALVSATIGTAMSIINALQTQPFIVGIVLAALAATMGAIQIAKIASQPIAAYAKGGVTKNEIALWGEKQPEVAVTTTGEVMFAESPTISKFDAGTRIYKSVSDFENYMSSKTNDNFTFDYDKMAQKMPKNEINLDATGLWSIATKEGERRKMINRRIKL